MTLASTGGRFLSAPFRLPLIAILRGIGPAEASDHVGALVEEGYDAIEIPLNSPDWAQSIGTAAREHGGHAWIGGGTVLRPAEVDTLQHLVRASWSRPTPIRH